MAQDFPVGWIPYLNLRPMQQELLRMTAGSLTLLSGHPTTVNRWLCEGTVALAPCSSINLLKANKVEIALPLGVASEGAVQSVYIGLRREHVVALEFFQQRQKLLRDWLVKARANYRDDWKQITPLFFEFVSRRSEPLPALPKIVFSPASAASVALSKLFLKLWCGPKEAESLFVKRDESAASQNFINGERPMELVIGDEALARRPEFSHVLDLGQQWWDLTGLPFVFAVWQTTSSDVPRGLRMLLRDAAELAGAKMRVDPLGYAPDPLPVDVKGRPIDLKSYWNVIQYALGPRHIDGLLFYLTLCSQFFDCGQHDVIPTRLARWAGRWPQLTQR